MRSDEEKNITSANNCKYFSWKCDGFFKKKHSKTMRKMHLFLQLIHCCHFHFRCLLHAFYRAFNHTKHNSSLCFLSKKKTNVRIKTIKRDYRYQVLDENSDVMIAIQFEFVCGCHSHAKISLQWHFLWSKKKFLYWRFKSVVKHACRTEWITSIFDSVRWNVIQLWNCATAKASSTIPSYSIKYTKYTKYT